MTSNRSAYIARPTGLPLHSRYPAGGRPPAHETTHPVGTTNPAVASGSSRIGSSEEPSPSRPSPTAIAPTGAVVGGTGCHVVPFHARTYPSVGLSAFTLSRSPSSTVALADSVYGLSAVPVPASCMSIVSVSCTVRTPPPPPPPPPLITYGLVSVPAPSTTIPPSPVITHEHVPPAHPHLAIGHLHP